MKKYLKLLSASAMSAALVLSTQATPLDAKENVTKSAATQTKVETNTTGEKLDKSKPYYYYNGYFGPNGKVVLTKQFRDAVNNNNVMIDGYMHSKKMPKKPYGGAAFYTHDSLINKADKNTIIGISLFPSKKLVSAKAFQTAYKNFKLVKTVKSNTGKEVTKIYQTKAGTQIQAYFVNGYLQILTI